MRTRLPGARLPFWAGILTTLAIGGLAVAPMAFAAGPAAPGLGTAGSFAVLAGSTVTSTGTTVITGDLGVSPGTAVTGFPPGTVSGATHAADAAALQAQTDLTTAYNTAAGSGPTIPVAADLGGQTLTPGVYNSASSLALTGTLTLSGTSSDVWIFQAGSTLTTASGSSVVFIGGATSCNVFWQIGTSATIGTGSAFEGTIMALTSITVTTGATIDGRALARNGAVTLDTNAIDSSTCAAPAPAPTPTPSASPSPAASASAAPTTTPSGLPNTAYRSDGWVAPWPLFMAMVALVIVSVLAIVRVTLAAERREL